MLVLTISAVIVVAFVSLLSPWALAQARFSYAAKTVLLHLATVTGLPGGQQLWVMSTHALSLGGGSDDDSYMTADVQQRSRDVSADGARDAPAQLALAVDAAAEAPAPAPSARSGDTELETPAQGPLSMALNATVQLIRRGPGQGFHHGASSAFVPEPASV